MRRVLLGLAVFLVAGCSTNGRIKRTVDASGGHSSIAFTVSVDGTIFIGATPAALQVEGMQIANIKRGETIKVLLPCGRATYAVLAAGSKGTSHDFPTRTLVLDPCDGGLKSLHISFQSFHGFSLSREA